MGKVVSMTTPLTSQVAAFVGRIQSKGAAVEHVEEPQVFRHAVRVEARRRGLRVRTGVSSPDPNVVWACDPDWKLSDEEYARASRRAANLFALLVDGARSRAPDE